MLGLPEPGPCVQVLYEFGAELDVVEDDLLDGREAGDGPYAPTQVSVHDRAQLAVPHLRNFNIKVTHSNRLIFIIMWNVIKKDSKTFHTVKP